MSKRGKLVGPDGRPIADWVRSRSRPDGDAVVAMSGLREGSLVMNGHAVGFMRDMSESDYLCSHDEAKPEAPDRSALAESVAAQVSELVAGFDGESRDELPEPPRDPSAYADAFAVAAQGCPHRDLTEMLYGREFLCEDCRRIVSLAEVRRARGGGYWS